jgi:glycosyltransferase involved in cell wall biosynthesis
MSKILVIASSLQPGGAEKSAIKLSNSLNSTTSHEIFFGTFFKGNADLYNPPDATILNLTILDDNKLDKRILFKNFLQFFSNLWKIRKTILLEEIDVVISFGAGIGCFTYLILFGTGVSQITSERISPDLDVYRPSMLTQLLRPWIYNHGVFCSVQSNDVQKLVKKMWGIESVVTPNHFEIPHQNYELQESGSPCVAVGRPDHQKGYDLLLSAWAYVETKHSNKLLIVADDAQDYLKNLIELNKLKNVEIKFPTNDLYSVYKDCALYISCSRFEGYPNATTEALIFGLPVLTSISSDVITDWKDQGICFVFNSNEPKLIATDICRVLGDPSTRSLVANQALSVRKNFNWESVKAAWIKIIEDALSLKNT